VFLAIFEIIFKYTYPQMSLQSTQYLYGRRRRHFVASLLNKFDNHKKKRLIGKHPTLFLIS